MTTPIFITWTCLMLTLPIVVALSTGHDPMHAYAAMFGMLARAAAYGLELRKGLGL